MCVCVCVRVKYDIVRQKICILFSVKLAKELRGRVKAIPLKAWTGPEGSRRLKFPDFKTVGI